MAIKTDAVLKTYFERGDQPTEEQFANLIDSKLGYTGVSLGTYEDNAAAIAGGLAVGSLYRTATGAVHITYEE